MVEDGLGALAAVDAVGLGRGEGTQAREVVWRGQEQEMPEEEEGLSTVGSQIYGLSWSLEEIAFLGT